MATTPKVLGQLAPAATTLTDIYTVPSATNTTISSIVICNTSATVTTFRFAIAKAGAANDIKQYVYYDLMLPGNDTFIATVGFTLEATDVVRVYAANATLSFSVFGIEET